MLRRGGLLVAVTWGDDYRELEVLQETRSRLGLEPRPTLSAAGLAARLSGADFRHVVVHEVRMPAVHASVGAYLAYRRAFGPLDAPVGGDQDAAARTLAACAGRLGPSRSTSASSAISIRV